MKKPTSTLPPPSHPQQCFQLQILSYSSPAVELLIPDVEEGDDGELKPKFRVRNFRKVSESRAAVLQGLDLDVPKGAIVGVIGPSGSGKSTLLRVLNRLWEPPSGTVYLDGSDSRELDVLGLRRKVGILFQVPVLFQGTVADNIQYEPQLRGKTLTDSQPTSALDPITKPNIEDVIVKLKKSRGMTIVMVSHSIKQIQGIADVVFAYWLMVRSLKSCTLIN